MECSRSQLPLAAVTYINIMVDDISSFTNYNRIDVEFNASYTGVRCHYDMIFISNACHYDVTYYDFDS